MMIMTVLYSCNYLPGHIVSISDVFTYVRGHTELR